jgi:DNA mismatch endonuclease (patch repair protein)
MDTLTVAQRSARMARIKSKDTKPELVVRKLVHGLGYRYRLHRRDLPGSPDLVFPGRQRVIFVHGCFWHAHAGCKVANVPKTKTAFWAEKFSRNKLRDGKNCRALRSAGWQVLVIWECEIKSTALLEKRVRKFLGQK